MNSLLPPTMPVISPITVPIIRLPGAAATQLASSTAGTLIAGANQTHSQSNETATAAGARDILELTASQLVGSVTADSATSDRDADGRLSWDGTSAEQRSHAKEQAAKKTPHDGALDLYV